jgi:hypothetical protein
MANIYKDILTVAKLKEVYLAGVQLTDASGVALPDAIFEDSIKAAVKHVETVCGITIAPVKVKNERQDLYQSDKAVFWLRGTFRRPLSSISRMVLKLGNMEILQFPLAWIYDLDPNSGTFTLIPSSENIAVFSHHIIGFYGRFQPQLPGGMEIDYTAGVLLLEGTATIPAGATTATFPIGQTVLFSDYELYFELVNPAPADAGIEVSVDATGNEDFDVSLSAAPTQDLTVRWVLSAMHADLKKLIFLMASIHPLNVAGTTLVGEGIASKSISIDGLSQSITTTANSETLAYGNRVKAHQAEIDKLLPYVRGRYTGPRISII